MERKCDWPGWPPPGMILTGDAALRLGVSKPTAHYWASIGKVDAVRTREGFWLFREESVNRVAKERRRMNEQIEANSRKLYGVEELAATLGLRVDEIMRLGQLGAIPWRRVAGEFQVPASELPELHQRRTALLERLRIDRQR